MKYVIIGSSAAGVNAARELRRLDPSGNITMISADNGVYSRCILHHFLSGERTEKQLCFVEDDFEARYNIDFVKNAVCDKVDVQAKTMRVADGASREYRYDKLLIASGASSVLPPVPGLTGAKNVFNFRSIGDVKAIKAALPSKKHPVIVGAGLVGCDVLTGLLDAGLKPTLVDIAPHLLIKQLDTKSAGRYENLFRKAGAAFYFNASLAEAGVNGAGEVERVVLKDGWDLPCDLLIAAAGVRANTAFLEGSGVNTDRAGILIDDASRTNVPDVFGAGDVTGHSPIWPVAVKQGIVAARNMARSNGDDDDAKNLARLENFFASKTAMNFCGVPTMSIDMNEAPDANYLVETSDTAGSYKKVIHKNGVICGAIVQGDVAYSGIITELVANKIDVSRVKKNLFDVDYADFFNMKENFEFCYEQKQMEAQNV